MRLPPVLPLLLLFAAGPFDRTWDFTQDEAGKPPRDWTVAAGAWAVVREESSPSKPNALAQQAKSDGATFNLIVADAVNLKHVEVSVQYRAVAGKDDQGGGVVWRYRDAKNYYICRANPLESNFRVYKVVDGKRAQLGTAEVKIDASKWHQVKASMSVDRIKCWHDGKLLLNVKDSTFMEAGKAGLWTKADAQTAFDDFHVTEAMVMGLPIDPHRPSKELKKKK